MTVNKCADVIQYPLPNTEDLFATLAGVQVFTKIHLSHTYQQVEMVEDLLKYQTINTHKGLYRLQMAVIWSLQYTSFFKKDYGSAFAGVKFTVCCLDDILISGVSPGQHLAILDEVFRHLQEHSIRFSHVMEKGKEKPITFASQTLTASERNYFQIEKEALFIVFGVKKFHSYLYGRRQGEATSNTFSLMKT